MKSTGVVKFFNEQKGFGFIVPDDGSKDLFFHVKSLEGGLKSLSEGDAVEYVESPGRKGPEATQVSIVR